MKYSVIIILISIVLSTQTIAQDTINFDLNLVEKPFKSGEKLKFKLHYGLINAGYVTLEVDDLPSNKNFYSIIGKGWTVGMFNWFFFIKDKYETHIHKQTLQPHYFKRNIDEGGYVLNRKINFDRKNNTAKVYDEKNLEKSDSLYVVPSNVQDLISTFYLARNIDAKTLKEGDIYNFNVFMDFDLYKFSLKFLCKDVVETTFGDIKCLKFIPLVQSGRVFGENESVALWISDDENKIPIRMESKLRFGALSMDIISYKGLKANLQSTKHQ
ncbi:MAG: DUF3108 domain-containing protein [Ichthyobacteriaceae bacterium]|nr:DUF3108 domain-containing protein [Ichthyobacteriaceae bacterium]